MGYGVGEVREKECMGERERERLKVGGGIFTKRQQRGGRRGGKEKKGQTRSKNYLGKEGGSKEEVRRKIPAEHCCSLSGQPCARKAWW